LESGLVGIVTIAATHDDAPSLPSVEPFAMRAVCPRVRLGEMTLGTQPVALVKGRPLAVLERKLFHVIRGVTGRAEGAGLLGVSRPDVLVRIGGALSGHDDLPAEMT
jgi:hypothetical protein